MRPKVIDKIRFLIDWEVSNGKKLIEVAQKMGLSHSSLWAYKNSNVTPDTETLFNISDAYDLQLDLFRESVPMDTFKLFITSKKSSVKKRPTKGKPGKDPA